jgi:osmotically-inducible protein OsmY
VTVRDGSVTLRGAVDSTKARRSLCRELRRDIEGGVVKVVSHLEVAYGPAR